jgi:A/G-specific adenine glycosylase
VIELKRNAAPLEANDGQTAWVSLGNIDAYGLPAPVRKLLGSLRGPLI